MTAHLKPDLESAKAAGEQGRKLTFKERMLHNFREFVAMFLYLWVLFALFTYHEAIVLAKHHIDYKPFGLAFVNAFVLAKIMLVAEDLRVGTRFRKRAPIFPVLHKSLLFAIIFICFNMAEEIVIGLWKGETLAQSIPQIGGGSLLGIVIASLIITVALIPFFAFRELSRVMGKGVLEALFLKRQAIDRALGTDEHVKQANRLTSVVGAVEEFQQGSASKSSEN